MSRSIAGVVAALVAAGQVARAQPAPAPAPATSTAASDAGMTTDVFQEHWHPQLQWSLLDLPERVVQLAFTPIGLLVAVTEEKRLDKRFKTLLSFWRFKVSPRFKLSFGDGLGVGLKLKYKEPVDERTASSVGFIYRLNGDYLLDADLEQPLGSLNDRNLYAHAEIERDVNERFYGIGGGSVHDSKRVIGDNHQEAWAAVDLQPTTWYDYSGLLKAGLYRQTLYEGVDASGATPSVMAGDTDVVPPQGFGTSTTYISAALSGKYDTRDTRGRPSRGTIAELSAEGLIGINDTSLGGVRIKAHAKWFLPVLPEARTLIIDVGGAATIPLYPGDSIPLSTYVDFGRENVLRGFDRVRFRDRYGAWASAEYRFPIYKYQGTPVGLDAFVYVDTATAWGDDAFQLNRVRWDTGGGLRLAAETTLVSKLTFAWSREGFQFFIGGEVPF